MSLQLLENVKFLHPVGASTFKYGITIPVEAQTERMSAIEKGSKKPVTILFGDEEPVIAVIRRLNNKPAHLQFRYENKGQERLRQFLLRIFGSHTDGNLLEVVEVSPFTFLFKPILNNSSPSLYINDMLLHRLDPQTMKDYVEIEMIKKSIAQVKYDSRLTQSDYNRRINENLVKQGWNCEQRVVDELGLRCDYEKNGVWVEVEFGNARSYYQDYVKFMLAKKYRDARLGLLLCPTIALASLLCELGRQRAHDNVIGEHAPVYSGMMNYEKAARELPFLGFMFQMPIIVAGVGVSADNMFGTQVRQARHL